MRPSPSVVERAGSDATARGSRPSARQPRAVLAELTALAAPAPPLEEPLTRHKVIGAFRRLFSAGGDAAPRSRWWSTTPTSRTRRRSML